jgi:pimeloyl-ACP methyl ester carboxylesterase
MQKTIKKTFFILFILLFFLFIKVSNISASNILYYDDFSSLNKNWTVKNGEWFIENEVYKTIIPSDISYESYATYININNSQNWDNYEINIDVMSKKGPGQNILFRLDQNFENYYWVAMRYKGCDDCNNIRLAKLYQGNYNRLAEIGPSQLGESLDLNKWYSLKIKVNKNNIKLFFQDKLILDFTDNHNPINKGTVGLEAWSGGWGKGIEFLFDNIKIIKFEEENYPVVLIPGFGGSWNLSALTSGLTAGPWVKTPFVGIYDNLQSVLVDSALLEPGVSYFEFYYDWRKDLSSLADDFNSYLSNNVFNTNPEAKINIVGHSMGGLVARAYAKKYGDEKLNKVITVGSPHKGVLKTYYAWEAGLVSDKLNLSSIAMQFFLHLQRKNFQTSKDIIRSLVPSIQNMLPVFNYLKNSNSVIIPTSSLIEQNNYFTDFEDNPSFKDKLVTISGIEDDDQEDTVEYYLVENRSILDKLLGLWPDGVPTAKEFSLEGDLTVLNKSSSFFEASNNIFIAGNHHQIMENQTGLTTITQELGFSDLIINNTPSSLARNPSLLFFLHSPAVITVTTPSGKQMGFNSPNNYEKGVYSQIDNLIFLSEYPAGNYEVEVKGVGRGVYEIEIGQFNQEKDSWQNLKSFINPEETHTYDLYFNPDSLEDNMLKNTDPLDILLLAKKRLEQLNIYFQASVANYSTSKRLQAFNTKNIKQLDKAIQFYEKNKYLSSKLVFSSLTGCFSQRRSLDKYILKNLLTLDQQNYSKKELQETIDLLKTGWLSISFNSRFYSKQTAQKYKSSVQRLLTNLENKIEQNNKEDKNLGLTYQLAKQSFNKGEEFLQKDDFKNSYINFVLARFYLLEARHLL